MRELLVVDPARFLAIPSGYLLVLRQRDDVFAALERLMVTEKIPSASLSGFGFVERARFGFFDFERQDYVPRDFDELEITGLAGSLAWKDGKPAIHAHASGGDRDFRVVGGHVLALIVGSGSFEMMVTVHPTRLERRFEADIGANVLQLPGTA